jgi:hypothetical protein
MWDTVEGIWSIFCSNFGLYDPETVPTMKAGRADIDVQQVRTKQGSLGLGSRLVHRIVLLTGLAFLQASMRDADVIKRLDRLDAVFTNVVGGMEGAKGTKSTKKTGNRDPDYEDAPQNVRPPAFTHQCLVFRTVCKEREPTNSIEGCAFSHAAPLEQPRAAHGSNNDVQQLPGVISSCTHVHDDT